MDAEDLAAVLLATGVAVFLIALSILIFAIAGHLFGWWMTA